MADSRIKIIHHTNKMLSSIFHVKHIKTVNQSHRHNNLSATKLAKNIILIPQWSNVDVNVIKSDNVSNFAVADKKMWIHTELLYIVEKN